MIYIYDIETYKKAFIVCALQKDTQKKLEFEISHRKDDIVRLMRHLLSVKGQIGYNNLDFDYPVLHWFLKNFQNYDQYSLPEAIYYEAQRIIDEDYSSINPSEVMIPQLDLFKIWHYNNGARATSLKYLEFNMRMDNIEDLPYEIDSDLTDEMIDEIIEYCHHDVYATYLFYLKSKNRISLRRKLSKKYGLSLMNKSDVGIAEELVLDSYCKLTGRDKQEVRDTKSVYDYIVAKDVILPQIKFKTKRMQTWLEKLKDTYLKAMDHDWKGEVIKLFDEEYQVGLGGLHIIQKSKRFIKANDEFLTEWDCAGMYPTFIALHGMYPDHLGKEFLTLYRQVRDDRMIAKKTGDSVMDAAGKLMGNGTFGKFGSDLSFLFDLRMLYTVTLNNQLFLLMLIEECGLNDIKVISANTDSITIFDKNSKLSTFHGFRTSWESISKHTLENTEYKQIAYRDVNNYIAETIEGKAKFKGAFDTFEDKDSPKFDGWHKNQSMMIVSIAIRDYYIKDIPIEDTIYNHKDIFDFCKVVKGIGAAKFSKREWTNREIIDTPLQKRVNRYIVTNKGCKLIKILPPLKEEDGTLKKDKVAKQKKNNQLSIFDLVVDEIIEKDRESEVEAKKYVTIVNTIKSKDIRDYDINYNYYINECYKIINEIEDVRTN
ncbi:MAG: hypothetical protein ACOC3V_01900 [bacterium]